MRFLLIRLTALGDVILVEPVVRAIREAHPGAEVDLITERAYQPLMARTANLDRVIPYDRHGDDRGARGLQKVIARLPEGPYDVVADLQGKLRTRALALRAPAKSRVTLRKRGVVRGALSLFGKDRVINDTHTVEMYLKTLSRFGVSSRPSDPRLVLSSAATRLPAESKLRIGLAPGARHRTKRWLSDRYAILAEAIAAQHADASFLLLGGPEDRNDLARIRAGASQARVEEEDVTGYDVERLAQSIAGLDLLIGVDSGPAHLARSLGVRTLTLFGPTSPKRWGPLNPGHEVARVDLPCSPCANYGGERCPIASRNHECMRTLSVDVVKKLSLELLQPPVPKAEEPTDKTPFDTKR